MQADELYLFDSVLIAGLLQYLLREYTIPS